MHGEKPISMEAWLKDTEWDDLRRYKMLRAALPNKTFLDFGCGAGGFLSMASSLVETATGIELEARVIHYYKGKNRYCKNIGNFEGGTT
jgi:2-polyprenyl-3-methyl-5-hydroxy-6-metoxy-1,4-benzoquinol methylase